MFNHSTAAGEDSPAKFGAGFGIRTFGFLAVAALLTLVMLRHYDATLGPALHDYKARHDSESFGGMAFVPVATILGYLAVFAPALIVLLHLDDLVSKSTVRFGLIWSLAVATIVAWVGLNLGWALLARSASVEDLAHSSRSAEHHAKHWAKKACRGHGGTATLSQVSKFTIFGVGDKMLTVTCADKFKVDSNPFEKLEEVAGRN